MKTILIGNKKFQLIENTKEISALRNLEIELYRMKGAMHGACADDVAQKIEAYKQGFNAGKMADCLIYLHELTSGIKQVASKFNPFHYIFALIVLEEGEKNEDAASLSSSFLEEKLQRIYGLGITEGEIEDYVANFLVASVQNAEAGLLKILRTASIK